MFEAANVVRCSFKGKGLEGFWPPCLCPHRPAACFCIAQNTCTACSFSLHRWTLWFAPAAFLFCEASLAVLICTLSEGSWTCALSASNNLDFRVRIVSLFYFQAFPWSLIGTLGIARVLMIINLVIGICIMEVHSAVMPGLCQPTTEHTLPCVLVTCWSFHRASIIFSNFLWLCETSVSPLWLESISQDSLSKAVIAAT